MSANEPQWLTQVMADIAAAEKRIATDIRELASTLPAGMYIDAVDVDMIDIARIGYPVETIVGRVTIRVRV